MASKELRACVTLSKSCCLYDPQKRDSFRGFQATVFINSFSLMFVLDTANLLLDFFPE